jgi:hypothetical protein
MKKYLLFLFAFSVFASCNTSDNTEKQTKNKTNQVVYPSDNPAERLVYENRRFKNPITGRVPNDMRRKEMMFAKTLPVSTKLTKANWIHRGPYNVGGRTRAIAFDVQDENIILAGGTSGGMFRSTDGGQSWTMTTDPGQLHNVTCVAQDTRVGKEDTWYFGSGENRGGWLGDVSFLGNGIYKSIDGGLSWDSLSITTSNTPQSWDNDFDFVWNIVTDPSNDSMDVVYAAVHGDIYKSSDGGISWDKKLGGNNSSYYQYTSVEITSSGVVYAAISSNCVNKGIWRSPDGETWTKIIDGNFPAVHDRIALDVNPNNEDEVYCIAANTTGFGQFTNVFFGGTTWTSLWKYNYLSGDGSGTGALWTDLSVNIPANQATTFDNFNAQGSYDLMIKVHPTDQNTVFIGGTNLWRSTDGFTSPNNTIICGGYLIGSYEGDGNWGVYPNHHPDQHDLLFLPSDNNVILSATDGGIFRSEDCFKDTVDWNSLNNGYYTTQLYTATTSNNANSDVLHGGFQDNGNFVTFSGNETDPWTMPFNGDGAYSGIANNEEDFYLTIQRGVSYKMKLDNNGNRLAYNRLDPLSADSTTYQFINPFTMDENDDNLCYLAAGSKLWRNNNLSSVPYNDDHSRNDIGWSTYTDGAFNSSMDITAISTSVNPPNVLYYGTDSKYIHRVNGANIGDPAHNVITTIPTGNNVHCSDIAIHPNDPDKIMVVFSNYSTYSLFYSDDAGGNWTKVAGNLEENVSGSGNGPSCRTAQILDFGNSTLYVVGTSVGLFATDNLDGQNTVWEMIGKDEIGNVIVEQIDYRHSDGRFTVATYGSGIFQTTITSVDDVLDLNDVNRTELNIYPNPTSDILNIEFDSKRSEKVKCIIYNEVGSKVKIYSENVSIGGNKLTYDVNTLKPGVYFVSLQMYNETITKQFIKE